MVKGWKEKEMLPWRQTDGRTTTKQVKIELLSGHCETEFCKYDV